MNGKKLIDLAYDNDVASVEDEVLNASEFAVASVELSVKVFNSMQVSDDDSLAKQLEKKLSLIGEAEKHYLSSYYGDDENDSQI
jgi:hypothetical protein